MDEITQLGRKYGTDKVSKHHYGGVYSSLFDKVRNEIKGVLEIGVAEGAGLYTFRDYFPNARIYGLDNEIGRVWVEDRIEVGWGSQNSREDLDKQLVESGIAKFVDIVVDDGSHKTNDQIFTCLYLMPRLKNDAIYIIEDVSDPETVAKALWHYDVRVERVGQRYDDVLVIVRRKRVKG